MGTLTKLLGAYVLTVSVTAVAEGSGSQFVGTWKKVHGRGPDTEVIERHGDFFVIKSPRLLMPTETEQASARLKDGTLEIQGELGSRAIHFDPSDGHIFTTHGEYIRVGR